MQIISNPAELSAWSLQQIRDGQRVALVPTMGFFHKGHLALMRTASGNGDKVVVSLFVNPLQFGPSEDLDSYPKDLERDVAMAEKEGVDVLFVPGVQEMYASEPSTIVSQSSSSKSRFASLCSPCLILSMTSTPRTEPILQGVHLPHDSTAQNSMAKRACSPISTVSSNTTMPP